MTKRKENSTYVKHSQDIVDSILSLKDIQTKDRDIADTLGVKFNYVRNVLRRFKVKAPPGTRSKNAAKKSSQEDIDAISIIRDTTVLTKEEISRKTGKTVNQVTVLLNRGKKRLTKQQLSEMRSTYSKELKEEIRKIRLVQRSSLEEIAERFGLSVDTVRYFCSGINLLKEKMKELGVGDIYSYLNIFAEDRGGFFVGEYKGMNVKSDWKCAKNHPVFSMRPSDVLNKHSWCPFCGVTRSIAELEIEAFIKSLVPEAEIWHNLKGLIHPKKDVDIYLPEFKVGFEHHGIHCHSYNWHFDDKEMNEEEKNNRKNKHFEKNRLCEVEGIRLIQIFSDEWMHKKEQVKGIIRAVLGKQEHKLGARKCEIKKGRIGLFHSFFETNHVQGSYGHVVYALIYNNEVVAAMSFKKTNDVGRGPPSEGVWELSRYCVKINHSVIGGGQRLLKAFIEEYLPKRIVSFSDNRWSIGGFYKKMGFCFERDVPPDYTYFKMGRKEPRLRKSCFRKDKIAQKFNVDMSNTTELEEMFRQGYDWIYDAGKRKWAMNLTPTPP